MRSDDHAKPVWGRQTGQAAAIDRTDRQVRRYRAEAEGAGLIETERAGPERDHEGRWTLLRTNLYRFVVPPARRKPR